MNRSRVFVAAVALAACTKPKPAAPKPPEEPKHDVATPWVDPEGFLPKGTSAPVRPLTDALADPGAQAIVIRGATILTATGERHEHGTIVLERGAISYVGAADAPVPDGARVIDGTGKFVTPGVIDAHSHLG